MTLSFLLRNIEFLSDNFLKITALDNLTLILSLQNAEFHISNDMLVLCQLDMRSHLEHFKFVSEKASEIM